MELNVDDYVRDKNGRIGKVFDITNEPSVDIGIGIMPEVNAVWIDKDKINYLYQEDITKHSKDIINLIEVGDYVNGKLVCNAGKNNNYIYLIDTPDLIKINSSDDIKSILTKEQFEANAYTIEKER